MPSLREPLIGIMMLVTCASLPAADVPGTVEFFESKIRPVLVEQCYKCHSEASVKAGKLRGGLKLDTRADWQKGGDSGPAVVAGKPAESALLKSLKYDGDVQMPPSGKLSAAVIADFEKWIKDGAVDPRNGEALMKTGIDFEKGRLFWSLQSPKSQAVPKLTGVGNAIDAFIQVKWNEKSLFPSPVADKRTLIRRFSFDLTGLPPTPGEMDAFVNDSSAEATAKLIDRLLASPAYGDRWGRYWLDVARYAEDQAHTFGTKPKSNAYMYRDWVIKAFNDDMPYDRFVRLQLAGDLMSDADPLFTKLAGLGLMGLGAEYYKNTAREQAIAEELDDRVDTLTRGFLGLTVACARCHDHKFDPIPTQDYYAIAGIFNGTNLTTMPLVPPAEVKAFDTAKQVVKTTEERADAFLTDTGKIAVKSATAISAKYLVTAREIAISKSSTGERAKQKGLDRYFLERWVKFLDPSNAAKAPAAFKNWFALKADAEASEVESAAESIQAQLIAIQIPDAALAKKNKKNGSDPAGDAMAKAMFQNGNAPLFITPADVEKQFLDNDAKQKLAVMRTEIETAKKAVPPTPLAAHVLTGNGRGMNVYIRGNPATKGEAVPKGFLRILSGPDKRPADYTRLDLANTIASPENPLTNRVIVNRVWAWHFGRGLVNTPSNFGALGERPSHPELLDYLTVEFVKNGSSLKWLHRKILASKTYQLAISDNAANDSKDAANQFLWRGSRKRLDIEAWRDSLLMVSGSLDTKPGGPAFDLKDASATRRTVYARVSRHELDGLLRIFDFPDANVTADKRNVTTVPQQQLFALNSEFMVNQAKAFAARVGKLGSTDTDRITAAYRCAYNRLPGPREIEIAENFLKLSVKPGDKLTRWQQYAQAILASNEFLYVD
ncbi:DUF1549 domain-containing protein [soil metagenome]